MNLTAIAALAKNDLRIHFADRRGVLINIAAAVFIAAFMGFVFGGSGKTKETGKLVVAIAVEDDSEVSRAIAAALSADKMIDPRPLAAAEARALVKTGKAQAGVVLPKGFGDAAAAAFFRGQRNPDTRPEIEIFYDPSQNLASSVVEGLLAQYVMQEVSRAMFGGAAGQKAVREQLDQIEKSTDAQISNRQTLKELLQSVDKLNAQTQQDRASDPAKSALPVAGLTCTKTFFDCSSALTRSALKPRPPARHTFCASPAIPITADAIARCSPAAMVDRCDAGIGAASARPSRS